MALKMKKKKKKTNPKNFAAREALPSTREARRADDPRKPGTHASDFSDAFNLPKSDEGRALGWSLEMWPQV